LTVVGLIAVRHQAVVEGRSTGRDFHGTLSLGDIHRGR
jgi:hypothetical protein